MLAVKGLQRVAGIELPGAEEGLKAKRGAPGMGEQCQHKRAVIAGQHLRIVIALTNEPGEFILLADKTEGVGLYLGGHKDLHRLAIFLKRYATLAVVQIQHRVEGVKIRRGGYTFCGCRCQNSLTPLRTLSISSGVPISSKR